MDHEISTRRTISRGSSPHLLAAVLALIATAPSSSEAQFLEWSVGPGVFVDSEVLDGAEVGPALSFAVTTTRSGFFSYGLFITVARTDFRVNWKELHRNWFAGGVGVRFAVNVDRTMFGLVLGAGVLLDRDVNESDPSSRDSGRGAEMLLPRLEAHFPLGRSWGITAFASDLVTGWFNTLLDPSEADLAHRFVFGIAVHFR